MQMFSCLKVFVFLGIVFLLVFNTVDVNAQRASLTMITGDTDEDKVYDVGDRLQATFIASDENGDPAMGVSLIMTHSGLTDVTISNGGTTDVLGVVIVEGTIAGDTEVYIQADWPDEQLSAMGDLPIAKQFAQAVFDRYFNTFQHPDVYEHFPGVLRAFRDPQKQLSLTSNIINLLVEKPRYIRAIAPEAHDSILARLLLDDQFRALFRDRQFHAVVRSTTQIDRLVGLIRETTPRPRDTICEVPQQPEPPRATTLSIVSGNNQSGETGKPLAQPFVVDVLDQDGKPLQGVAVTFATVGKGHISGHRIHTDIYGQAQTTLTLGARSGLHSVTASAVGITQTQTFTATAIAPPPPPDPEPVVSVQPPTTKPSPPPMYWIEGNTIYHRPTGDEKEIFLEPKGVTLRGGLTVDTMGRKVYWTEETSHISGRIQSANLDATGVQMVRSIRAVPLNITVGTDKNGKRWVYWTNSAKKIQRINVDGSGFNGDFMKFSTPPNHIAFDEGEHKLYWTEEGRIIGVAANGKGKRETIAEGLGELGGIAVANGVVYWTEQMNGVGEVRSMNGTGNGNKLLAGTESIPGGIAVDPDGGKVYWRTSDGEIQSAPLTGGIQTDVTSEGHGAGPATGIALGGTAGMSANQAASAPSVSSVTSVVSVESALLANYPNPFNPETWIPYQLSSPADVSISIYSINGSLVCDLDLGHQSAGVYRSRSRAAYWDGRNAFGERVASGLYFYTLTAGDFTATRKMLIQK